jgi:hypothetical protein
MHSQLWRTFAETSPAQPPPHRLARPAEGDKRKFLATLDPKVIKNLNFAATQRRYVASKCPEKTARQWLERREAPK